MEAIAGPSAGALPRTKTCPSRSKTTQGVAIGSRCAHLRAKALALGKNAVGSPAFRELCAQRR